MKESRQEDASAAGPQRPSRTGRRASAEARIDAQSVHHEPTSGEETEHVAPSERRGDDDLLH